MYTVERRRAVTTHQPKKHRQKNRLAQSSIDPKTSISQPADIAVVVLHVRLYIYRFIFIQLLI